MAVCVTGAGFRFVTIPVLGLMGYTPGCFPKSVEVIAFKGVGEVCF
jgi:hypothetical protein